LFRVNAFTDLLLDTQVEVRRRLLPFVFRRDVSSPDLVSSSSHNWLQAHTQQKALNRLQTSFKLTRSGRITSE